MSRDEFEQLNQDAAVVPEKKKMTFENCSCSSLILLIQTIMVVGLYLSKLPVGFLLLLLVLFGLFWQIKGKIEAISSANAQNKTC